MDDLYVEAPELGASFDSLLASVLSTRNRALKTEVTTTMIPRQTLSKEGARGMRL